MDGRAVRLDGASATRSTTRQPTEVESMLQRCSDGHAAAEKLAPLVRGERTVIRMRICSTTPERLPLNDDRHRHRIEIAMDWTQLSSSLWDSSNSSSSPQIEATASRIASSSMLLFPLQLLLPFAHWSRWQKRQTGENDIDGVQSDQKTVSVSNPCSGNGHHCDGKCDLLLSNIVVYHGLVSKGFQLARMCSTAVQL